MNCLRCVWTVRAGLIPGVDMPEHTKQWALAAGQLSHPLDAEQLGLFNARRDEAHAHAYAKELTDPRRVNWVTVEFMWM